MPDAHHVIEQWKGIQDMGIKLELDQTEASALKEALSTYLNQSEDEIQRTDDRDFRNVLRKRRETLEKVACELDRLLSGGDRTAA